MGGEMNEWRERTYIDVDYPHRKNNINISGV